MRYSISASGALIAVALLVALAPEHAEADANRAVFAPVLLDPTLQKARKIAAFGVIRSESEWVAFWKSVVDPGVRLGATAPDINFDTHTAVVVTVGERPSGGYDIVFDGLMRVGYELQLQAYEMQPGENCIAISALTYPAGVALIRRTDGEVSLELNTARYNCKGTTLSEDRPAGSSEK